MSGSKPQGAADEATQTETAATEPVVTETANPVVTLDDASTDDGATAVDLTPDPANAAAPSQSAAKPETLSRADAASLAEIGAQAARMGVKVDVAQAIRQGMAPDALRARVLEAASARDVASDIVVSTPATSTAAKESPVVAAAKRSAAASAAGRAKR